jgi:hypothetical protein
VPHDGHADGWGPLFETDVDAVVSKFDAISSHTDEFMQDASCVQDAVFAHAEIYTPNVLDVA